MTHPLSEASADAPLAERVDDLALASLLSSRICHDLAGPIGALSNGVGFLVGRAEGEDREHALEVIKDSARAAAARLQVYRAAFGAGGSMGEHVRASDYRDFFVEGFRSGRVSIDWQLGDEAVPSRAMRLLLNMALIAVEAMPRGGVARVGLLRQASLSLIVMAEGTKLRFESRAQGLVKRGDIVAGPAQLEPKEAPLLLTNRLAAQMGAELTFGVEEARLALAATLPA